MVAPVGWDEAHVVGRRGARGYDASEGGAEQRRSPTSVASSSPLMSRMSRTAGSASSGWPHHATRATGRPLPECQPHPLGAAATGGQVLGQLVVERVLERAEEVELLRPAEGAHGGAGRWIARRHCAMLGETSRRPDPGSGRSAGEHPRRWPAGEMAGGWDGGSEPGPGAAAPRRLSGGPAADPPAREPDQDEGEPLPSPVRRRPGACRCLGSPADGYTEVAWRLSCWGRTWNPVTERRSV